MLFGTGLVKTVNDFGAQGEWPSHPELLDWLAADFMRDWDVKRALKQIVMCATYRQSAKVSPKLLEKDGENRLLARGPRQRLDAEFLRDNALAVAGILNPQLGGKSFKPAQPPGTWEINEMSGYKYAKSKGDETLPARALRLLAPLDGLSVLHHARRADAGVLQRAARTHEHAAAIARADERPGLRRSCARLRAAHPQGRRQPTMPRGCASPGALRSRDPPTDREIAILGTTLETQLATYTQDKAAAAALVKVGDLAEARGRRRQRARRVDGGRECPAEPERNDLELTPWTNSRPNSAARITRRTFLQQSSTGLGALALTSLLNPDLFAMDAGTGAAVPGALKRLHFAPKAKRIIYLFMSGAPSHLDLFDPKPKLTEMTGKDLPDSVRKGQRITDDDERAEEPVLRRIAVQVCEVRQGRHGHLGAAAEPREDRGRLHLRPLDLHRSDQSRSGRHLFRHRQPAAGPPDDGRVARLRPRQRRIATCRPSSC